MYCSRVRIGNWYESIQLEEYKLQSFLKNMKKGNMMLAKKRAMYKNLESPTELTQSSSSITFGSKIALFAPYIKTPQNYSDGVVLGGRINANEIVFAQDLFEGCTLCGLCYHKISKRNTFNITSADYCNREGETLKYNQEFLLSMYSTVNDKPLFIRYDFTPCPGCTDSFPLYLSHNAVSNTRWRILPVQKPNITRFEQEGKPVPVNTDIVINHCATNINLGISSAATTLGIHGIACIPEMKTLLDIYKREKPYNLWQIHIPVIKE